MLPYTSHTYHTTPFMHCPAFSFLLLPMGFDSWDSLWYKTVGLQPSPPHTCCAANMWRNSRHSGLILLRHSTSYLLRVPPTRDRRMLPFCSTGDIPRPPYHLRRAAAAPTAPAHDSYDSSRTHCGEIRAVNAGGFRIAQLYVNYLCRTLDKTFLALYAYAHLRSASGCLPAEHARGQAYALHLCNWMGQG